MQHISQTCLFILSLFKNKNQESIKKIFGKISDLLFSNIYKHSKIAFGDLLKISGTFSLSQKAIYCIES
ncbi:hypothetical protein KUTeg_013840, partial [Tegillarca granosa]